MKDYNQLENQSSLSSKSALSKVACVGAGYVGSLSMSVLALKNPEVSFTVYDKNEGLIDQWNKSSSSSLPFFEPNHSEILQQVNGKNLHFSANPKASLQNADVIYIAVDTPPKSLQENENEEEKLGQAADMKNFMAAVRDTIKIALESRVKKDRILIQKSTVPVKTAQSILAYIQEETQKRASILKDYNSRETVPHFEILSVPQFLAEGSAINNLLNPDRVLIGHSKSPSGLQAYEKVKALYSSFVEEKRILSMETASSEIGKLLANAMLAQRISAINSISALCQKVGGDILEVKKAVGSDKRIGAGHLNPSVGFGGSCFRKDVLSLIYILKSEGLEEAAHFWNATLLVNEWQKKRLSRRVLDEIPQGAKMISILGLAYKKNTSDTRQSPTVKILSEILKGLQTRECVVKLYDPHVTEESVRMGNYQFVKEMMRQGEVETSERFREEFSHRVFFSQSLESCLEGSSGIVVLTDEEEFKAIDPEKLQLAVGEEPVVLDYRCLFNSRRREFESHGIRLKSLGTSL